MSVVATAEVGAGRAEAVKPRTAAIVLLALAAALVLSWPGTVQIWTTGQFNDTDDAMRLVQVRAWLDGQGWFDLVAHRLHPPAGLLMHWSRVVDVPLGGLIRFFECFTDAARAETLARLAFPLALQLALIAAVIQLGLITAGARAGLPAAVLVVASGFMFGQFQPGRIDHHAPQIVLLVGMTAAVLRSLDPGRAWTAALTAAALATSLAISLENLPFAAVIVAVLPLAWVVRPDLARAPMRWFAVGLAISSPLVFAATVPPARYGDPVGDAYSIVHVTASLLGSLGLLILGALTPRLRSAPRRAGCLVLAAVLIAGITTVAFPTCLHGPYAAMDPLLNRLWLSHVSEALPLLASARSNPSTATVMFCPLLAGALACLVAVRREAGVARLRWAVILALILVGIAGTFWEIRVASSAQPLALMGGVWAVARASAWAEQHGSRWRAAAVVALLMAFAPLSWAMVTPSPSAANTADARAGQACESPAAVSSLATLPVATVFAPIDDGAYILVHTPHAVVAAPYHRNGAGNRTVLDGFLAAPDAAAPIVRATGARYVVLCPGEGELSILTREAPGGLAAALLAGASPSWLRPVPLSGTPFRAYEVR